MNEQVIVELVQALAHIKGAPLTEGEVREVAATACNWCAWQRLGISRDMVASLALQEASTTTMH